MTSTGAPTAFAPTVVERTLTTPVPLPAAPVVHRDANGREITDFMTPASVALYDETGRIIGGKTQGIGFIQIEMAAGERMVLGDSGWDRNANRSSRYVDLSGSEPTLRDRPVLTQIFDRATLRVREEATLASVPACTVTFKGPINGTYQHPGGDLPVGFTVPGAYELAFEPFPYMPATYTLTVTP